jgi:hypothetical protein
MDANRLVRHPAPIESESVFGYLLRLLENNDHPKKPERHMDKGIPPSSSSSASASTSSYDSKPSATPDGKKVPHTIQLVESVATFAPVIQLRGPQDETVV